MRCIGSFLCAGRWFYYVSTRLGFIYVCSSVGGIEITYWHCDSSALIMSLGMLPCSNFWGESHLYLRDLGPSFVWQNAIGSMPRVSTYCAHTCGWMVYSIIAAGCLWNDVLLGAVYLAMSVDFVDNRECCLSLGEISFVDGFEFFG